MLLFVHVGVWKEMRQSLSRDGGRNVSAVAFQQVITSCSKQTEASSSSSWQALQCFSTQPHSHTSACKPSAFRVEKEPSHA